MFESVKFKKLKEYNDGNSIVMLGVLFNETEDEIAQVDEWFHEIRLIPTDAHVTDLHHIVDNVLGDEGRSDYLFYRLCSCTVSTS